MSTVTDAIDSSVQENRIVTLEPDLEDYAAVTDELSLVCDDSVRAGDVTEYWGTDEEDEPWRVHVEIPGGAR